MTDLTTALREAYASAPTNVVIYHTLELFHPSFTQAIRVVRDFEPLQATLERSAPRDAHRSVRFEAFAFDFVRPEITGDGPPRLTIEIDNVSREILSQVELAVETTSQISVIYREYLSTDLSAPQNDPPLQLTVSTITATISKITATAVIGDYNNIRFPGRTYDINKFPGLVQ